MKEKKSLDRERLSALIPATFLSFTFCIFGPVELYISNIAELWFELGDILLPSIIVGLLGCGVFFLIGFFLPKRLRKWYCCFLIGLGIALYVQGNFIHINYGVLAGQKIQWEDYGSVAIWNTAIWIVCLVLPFAAQILLKDKFKSVSATILCCVLLVQVITLATLIITTDFSKYERDGSYLSARNLYTVSQNKNVIIFVLDKFDQTFFDNALNEEPEITDMFDGFTSYVNTNCAYPVTKGSLPFMMTGQYYKNEQEYNDYLTEAFQNTNYYKALQGGGFDIGLYTGDAFVSKEARKTFVGNAELGDLHVSSAAGLEKAMLQFTAFRYFPHIAKQYVWLNSEVFDQFKTTDLETVPNYSWDNLAFYEGLKEEGLTFIPEGNAYRFIHLCGMHTCELDKNVTVAEDGKASYVTHGIACLKIVGEYLRQLKELGVYDNTMVIVVADHGEHRIFGSAPMMMMKGFNDAGGFRISEVPVDHSNLIPTVLDATGLVQGDAGGVSVYDIDALNTIDRKYYWCDYFGNNLKEILTDPGGQYLPDIVECIRTEDGEIIQTGNRYTSRGLETFAPYAYELGSSILSTDNLTANHRFFSGCYNAEGDAMWSMGHRSVIRLNIGEVSGDLAGEFCFKTIHSRQRLVVRCGERILYDAVVASVKEPTIFLIPADCVNNGMMKLDIEYPDAYSPASRGESNDARVLAFMFKSIRVCSADEISADEQPKGTPYQLDSAIVFTDDDNGCRYFTKGISSVEGNFAWSLGTTGQMLINIEGKIEQLAGEIQFDRILEAPQRLIVRCGDLLLYDEEILSAKEAVQFTIPGSCVKDGLLTLDLEYPNAFSPKSRGWSEDSRELAFAFKSIRFYQSGR